jgi:enoyl-CoA hydratase
VRAIYQARNEPLGPGDYKYEMYRGEYGFIRRLARFPKPYVALVPGITLGGGAGVSINGTLRVATDGTEVGMPEVLIGSTPDVGATRFLNRCPGHFGMYLALTGGRARTGDAIWAGLATHYVPRDRFAALTDVLAGVEWRAGQELGQVEEAIARFAERPPPASWPALQPAIDRVFGQDSIGAVLAALRRETGDWAKEALAAMERASPLSLAITFRQMQIGAHGIEIEQALALEFRIVQNILPRGDFFEGVRALLVEKDKKPRWRFPTVADIPDGEVDAYFASLGERELRF